MTDQGEQKIKIGRAILPDGRAFDIESEGTKTLRQPVTTFAVTTHKFLEWYRDVAANDGEMIWEKAMEYGGMSLTAEALGVLMGHLDQTHHNYEAALAVNAAQKVNRILEALAHGELPSADCWRDLVCYAMIARRLRETKGAWPA